MRSEAVEGRAWSVMGAGALPAVPPVLASARSRGRPLRLAALVHGRRYHVRRGARTARLGRAEPAENDVSAWRGRYTRAP